MQVATWPPALCRPDPLLDRLGATARTHATGPAGARVHWSEWGDPDGPVMVMLHGAYGSWRHFARNIDAFAGDHRVLVPDLPGYGLSDMPDQPARIADIGTRIAAHLDLLIGPATPYRLVGFSFGGAVAARLLAGQAGRQSHALLIAPAGLGTPITPPTMSIRNRTGDALVAAQRANLQSLMLADPAAVTDQALRIQQESTAMARLRVERVDWGAPLSDILPGVTCPLTVLWGDRDAFVAPERLARRPADLRALNPAMDARLVAGMGHWLQYEDAAGVNATLRALIAG